MWGEEEEEEEAGGGGGVLGKRRGVAGLGE